MQRDLRKAVQEYDKRFGAGNNGQFYVSDLNQIMDMSGYKQTYDVYSVMCTALKVGFIVGRRSSRHNI